MPQAIIFPKGGNDSLCFFGMIQFMVHFGGLQYQQYDAILNKFVGGRVMAKIILMTLRIKLFLG